VFAVAVIAPVAQRIEHLTTDQKVWGSNPYGRADWTKKRRLKVLRRINKQKNLLVTSFISLTLIGPLLMLSLIFEMPGMSDVEPYYLTCGFGFAEIFEKCHLANFPRFLELADSLTL
jgi:hypothetical protein